MICSKCGKEVSALDKTCPNCGNPLTGDGVRNEPINNVEYSNPALNFQPATSMPAKNKVTAALLAFFLGGLGIHNFYLGHTSKAVTQLILTLTIIGSIPVAIWAFVEFIMILTGDIKDSSGRNLI